MNQFLALIRAASSGEDDCRIWVFATIKWGCVGQKSWAALCSKRGSPRQRWPFFYEQCSEKPCAVAHCSRAKRRTVDSLTPSTSAVVFTNDTIGSGKRACSTAFIGPLCFSCLANVWIDIFCATEESVTQIIASAENVRLLVVSTVLHYFASLKISITASLW